MTISQVDRTATPSGSGDLHSPQAPDQAGAPHVDGAEQSAPLTITRVFRADLRRPVAGEEQAAKDVLSKLRHASFLCAQFGNEVLTANYLLYRHKGDTGPDLIQALLAEAAEAKGRYKAWGDRLSSYTRDAITRTVAGLVKARGKEVMRGEASLPTFRRRGAIRVRERGVKLYEENKRLFCELKILPDEWLKLELWVKNLHKSPQYRAVLDYLLAQPDAIGQAVVSIVDGYRVSVRFAYTMPVAAAEGDKTAAIFWRDNEIVLRCGAVERRFGYDVTELARRKAAIEARRIQCWRLLRGKRVKARRARIYRSGTLRHISEAWINYSRTWAQQLAAALVKAAVQERAIRLQAPSAKMMADWFVSAVDYGLLSQSIKNAAERAGIKISPMLSESEQEKGRRKNGGSKDGNGLVSACVAKQPQRAQR